MSNYFENAVVLDCEVYPNYFLAAFKNIDNNRVITIEIKGEDECLTEDQVRKLRTIMAKRFTFGFNSRNFDIPIILYAINGKTALEIFKLCDRIISSGDPGWKTMKQFGLYLPKTMKHFDIQEPAPGVRVSLKLYGGRMHSKKLQDLPIGPGSTLTEQNMEDTKVYCINDLDTTIELFREVEERMNLRVEMSKQYGQDLLSKSDAQIAEVVIKSEIQKKMPTKRLRAPKISPSMTFKYPVPKYIKFRSLELQEALKAISSHNFGLDGRGSIKLPDKLKKLKIKLGYSTYQLGIGGIHSVEKKQTVIPDKHQILADRDVESYYPRIILNLKLFPKHLGKIFLDIYENIVDTRLHAKVTGDKIANQSLKIVINGSFGKLGSKYSVLYSPDLMLTVTLTGQLALLMLIEELELNGISVVSANTDGFVSLMPKSKYELYDAICNNWENRTKFKLEENQYKSLFSRDVNNYLALTKGKKPKGKGIFTINQLGKNPQATICVVAVMNLLDEGVPIYNTIMECKDITQFLTIRTVNGGAVYKNQYLGRVVRWIYSKEGATINYKKNGNKVPKSDASRPLMTLDGEWPDDLDYDRYIKEATNILDDIGLSAI